MSGYVKLFSDIVESSIWDEDAETRVVWVTLLALADSDGYVRGSPGWLAGKARVTETVCCAALSKFQAPDPRSRTPASEGRRIEALTDGWLILNYLAFRERLSGDPKAVLTRERVRKHRERYMALRNARNVTGVTPASASVSESSSGIKEGAGNHQGEIGNGAITFEMVRTWVQSSNKLGSDYTVKEAHSAFLAFEANGWMWGKNPVVDYRAAIERQILTDRDNRKPKSGTQGGNPIRAGGNF